MGRDEKGKKKGGREGACVALRPFSREVMLCTGA